MWSLRGIAGHAAMRYPSHVAYAYFVLDVFTSEPLAGNPLAVFPDATGLSSERMQAIAKELSLSETTFVMPPRAGGNFWVRIFTPRAEIPMAGHPTIGTAVALAHLGRIDCNERPVQVVFEEGVGNIEVTVHPGVPIKATMQQPTPSMGETFTDRAALAEVLGVEATDLHPDWQPQVMSSGVPFLYVPMRSLEVMQRLSFDMTAWRRHLGELGAWPFVFSTETTSPDTLVHSRMFAPGAGILEDPATGGAHGPLAAYLVRVGLLPPSGRSTFIGEQGIELGRPSRIEVELDAVDGQVSAVWVSGHAVLVARAELLI